MTKLFAHFGAGHLTLLYAVPWTPWLLLTLTPALTQEERRSVSPLPVGEGPGVRAMWDQAGERESVSPLPVGEGPGVRADRKWASGVVLALIFLTDPRWAAYAGLLWTAYLFTYSQFNWRDKIWRFLSSLGLTILLSAPLLLPLLEYTSLSTRSSLAPEEVFSHSLPPAQLLGMLFPSRGGSAEWAFYAGGAGLVLTLLALTDARIRKKTRFWLWAAGLSLVFALGSHLPGLALLARLPGFSLLRVPPRTLFLVGLALPSIAAYSVEHLLSGWALNRAARLILVGLVAAVFFLGGGIWALTGELPFTILWGVSALLLAALWIGVGRERVSPQVWLVGLFLLGAVDWAGAALMSYDVRPNSEVFSHQGELAEYLSERPGHFRVYSPSYSLPQRLAAQHGLELADGVDPLRLTAYAKFMETATGIPQEGYSVTLPPFAGGDPSRDNAAYFPDARLLGLLNVRYIAAEFDLEVEGLVLREQFGETRLYENQLTLPRAWVQPADTEPGQSAEPAELVAWKPNRITIRAEGPGLLVLSEIDYPGWRVRVDGQNAEMQAVAGILRGVELAEGEHHIEFFFRPWRLYVGGLIGLSSLIGLIGLNGLNNLSGLSGRKRPKRKLV
ncbi:MAG: hypothetical protein MAG431_02052 [Chloroflexi bacterium]|nr:hypothetical protein [Chloroflexota bacterium]